MGVRRQSREAALQALFMCDFLGCMDATSAEFCLDHFGVPKAVKPYAKQLCDGALGSLVHIDAKLTCASENWSLNRMARVDRTILRVATFEIAFLHEIPINVAINEAIEIAKRFGSDESPHFVNGVLDRVASLARPRAEAPLEVEVIREAKPLPEDADLPFAVALGEDDEAGEPAPLVKVS